MPQGIMQLINLGVNHCHKHKETISSQHYLIYYLDNSVDCSKWPGWLIECAHIHTQWSCKTKPAQTVSILGVPKNAQFHNMKYVHATEYLR